MPSNDPPTTDDRSRRAPALPPDERRATIVAATVELLTRHGTDVTTRQIAEAAGIAEGTIFRVFDDKDALIRAAIDAVFDPASLNATIDAIDASLPLEQRLEAAVIALRKRMDTIGHLIASLGAPKVVGERSAPGTKHANADLASLTALFQSEADSLRVDPVVAAQVLRGMTFASSHPAFVTEVPLSPAEIVALVLDGVRGKSC